MTSSNSERSSRDPHYAYSQYLKTSGDAIYQQSLIRLLDSLLWGSTSVGYPSDSFASCLFVADVWIEIYSGIVQFTCDCANSMALVDFVSLDF